MKAIKADVVVMSQACDLEQNKIAEVVLCPCLALSRYKQLWEAKRLEENQQPTAKAWSSHCKHITDGTMWHMFMLDSNQSGDLLSEHRIVHFSSIHTAPRVFLDQFIAVQNKSRLRLLPPYREHLSQSFARYFMRVGLPQNVSPAW